jgi:hypothetical protein
MAITHRIERARSHHHAENPAGLFCDFAVHARDSKR